MLADDGEASKAVEVSMLLVARGSFRRGAGAGGGDKTRAVAAAAPEQAIVEWSLAWGLVPAGKCEVARPLHEMHRIGAPHPPSPKAAS